jgi:hypothetical protein
MAATPKLTPDQISEVTGLVAQYISTQREKYAPRAMPLSAPQSAAMNGFFTPQLLESARLLVLQGERVANPDFYPKLKTLGFNNLPDQSAMGAITFSDVVVSHEAFSNGLLFHELVHVEQYRQLGIPRFSDLYVRGFLNGGSYEAIPLEVNAYTLGGRFESDPRRMFSVEDEVVRWAAEGRSDEQSAQRTTTGYRRHGAECFADRTSLHRPAGRFACVLRFRRSRRRKCRWFHAWQDHRLGSGAIRNRRCVRDCAGRKSGGFGVGSLRQAVLPRGHARRNRQVGRVGRRFLSANE